MEESLVACRQCGAANELPPEALAAGRYRCHACGQVSPIALPTLPEPAERPLTHDEPVQTDASFTPSRYNTPDAMRQAEVEATRFGCLVGLLPAALLLLWWL